MTLQEILKTNGVTDDSAAAILACMKENGIFTAGEENLDDRYKKLKADSEAQAKQSAENARDSEAKISQYETRMQAMEKELQAVKLEAAVKLALAGAKARDVEYMAFKLREKGELVLDQHGGIKGIEEMLAGLKNQFPEQFESAGGGRSIQVQKLPGTAADVGMTKAEFMRKPYAQRAAYAAENPEAYASIVRGG